MKPSRELLYALQVRAARGALGPSSMRGRGSKGVVDAGRAYLSALDLSSFGTTEQSRFRCALDTATRGLQASFPKSARHWGLARKGLNIFLRECLYTIYLRRAYSLHRCERFLEVPLDSLTGRQLHRESKGAIPRWRTVRGLTPAISDEFQSIATLLAARRRFARVHLDAFWWGVRAAETEA